jgi:asparagine synthase (glutamine-hydrolysing)
MCGICGFIELEEKPLALMRNEISGMCDSIRHRGPDEQGNFIDEKNGLALGHQRLSIIDVSSGQQPMTNENSKIQIIFNGEIYNYLEIKKSLEQKGHQFKTNSDTETIIHAYEEWGEDCLHHLRGMFAFAIWDANKKSLFCARDRIGIKPFYYFWDQKKLIFGSEIKAILAHSEVRPEVDNKALINYLRLFYIPAPQTIYKNIYKLPPGHTLLFYKGRIVVEPYWDLKSSIENQKELSLTDASAQLRQTLQEAVDIRLISEVPLGAFLSGGVDSSIVVALMSQTTGSGVMSHCVGFEDKYFNESMYSREMADRFGCNHSEITLQPDVRDILPKLIWHMDEPFADSSMIPTYYICQEARKRVTVCLSGDGGDELFAGYNWYAEMQRLQQLDARLPSILKKGFGHLGKIMPDSIRGATFLRNLNSSWENRHVNLLGGFTDNQISSLLGIDLLSSKSSQCHPLSVLYNSKVFGKDPVLNAQHIDLNSYMVEDILMKVDKMSMAHSLEVRVPLLDHKFVELAFSLSTKLKINDSQRKIALKESVSDLIPKQFFNRKKQGFSIPQKKWLQNELHDYVHDYLLTSSSQASNFFDLDEMKKLWKTMNNGKMRIDLSPHIWALLSFELWGRTFLNPSKGKHPIS